MTKLDAACESNAGGFEKSVVGEARGCPDIRLWIFGMIWLDESSPYRNSQLNDDDVPTGPARHDLDRIVVDTLRGEMRNDGYETRIGFVWPRIPGVLDRDVVGLVNGPTRPWPTFLSRTSKDFALETRHIVFASRPVTTESNLKLFDIMFGGLSPHTDQVVGLALAPDNSGSVSIERDLQEGIEGLETEIQARFPRISIASFPATDERWIVQIGAILRSVWNSVRQSP